MAVALAGDKKKQIDPNARGERILKRQVHGAALEAEPEGLFTTGHAITASVTSHARSA